MITELIMTDKATTNDISKNPFTPEFGRVPNYMAGRSLVISDMIRALEEGSNDPNLCTIFVGARGTGKTAMLSYLSNKAEQLGWISANVTATSGMLDDIIQRIQESAKHLIDSPSGKKLSGIEIANVASISWENADFTDLNWRSKMNLLFEKLSEKDCGILITVDELDPTLDEMVQLVTTYQHFVREGKKVALFMAGLPHNVSTLLSGKTTSFLRRASRQEFGILPDYEVEEAFRLTIEDAGRMIDRPTLELATSLIDGFPFMFQLVGFRAWNAAHGEMITSDNIRTGARLAQKEIYTKVFDATYAELSNNDRAFLNAMLASEGASTREELMKRLEKGTSHISTYKKRLMESGVIEEPEPGKFIFALPGFREYLRDKTAE